MQSYPSLRDALALQIKKRTKKEVQTDSDLSVLGPILVRAKDVYDEYTMQLKNDQIVNFNRAEWTKSSEDNFVTIYKKTADGWLVSDVCLDDVTMVTIKLGNQNE